MKAFWKLCRCGSSKGVNNQMAGYESSPPHGGKTQILHRFKCLSACLLMEPANATLNLAHLIAKEHVLR